MDASDTRTYVQDDANNLKTRQKSETLKNEPKMTYSPGGSARSQTSDMWKRDDDYKMAEDVSIA